ncbi:MAG TPA: hypothetical protein VHL58_06290 [Thermoanaerobaculia bacterium]|nr:hypothetical protein [Thermoanaerobaculia bacterium]
MTDQTERAEVTVLRFTVEPDTLSILIARCERCGAELRSIFPSNRRFTDDFRAKVRAHCEQEHAAKGRPMFAWHDCGSVLEVSY